MVFQVEKDDGLPTKICSDCKVKISDVFCFKEKCKKSLELLRKIFKIPEKIVETVVPHVPVVLEKKLKEKIEPKIVIIKHEAIEIEDVEQDSSVIGSVEEQIEEMMQDEENEEEIYLDEEFVTEIEKPNEDEVSPEKYKCTICNAEFLKSNDIKLHLKEVHSEDIDIFEISGDEMYLEYNEDMDAEEVESDAFSFTIDELTESNMFCCSKCNIQFETVKSLHDHQQHLHSKQTKIKTKRTQIKKHFCELCLTNISGQDRIDDHVEMHKKTLPSLLETIYYFQCGKCSQIFLKQSNLFDHTDCEENDLYESKNDQENFIENYLTDIENCQNKIFTCEKHEDDSYKCSICDIIFEKTFNSVIKHFVEDHPNADLEVNDACKTYQCSICKTSFKNAKEAMAHMYILHLSSFSCPIDDCGNEYNMFSKLSVHIQRLHLNEQHICKHCMSIFQSPQELSIHLRDNCVQRILMCNMCDKKFLTEFSLKLHLRMHNKEKRFSCSFCEKKFVQRGDLTTHERIHTGDRPFKCPICDNRFRTSGHKKDHMSTHVSDKKFECGICSKKFKAERILKGHMKAHENGKQFSCPGNFFFL